MTYLFSNTSSIFQSNGSAITTVNPLPVTLGSANINIIGNITIPTTVNVASSPDNPVHTHITEVGTSGNLLANNISYLPIGGNVTAFQGTNPWTIVGNVTANLSANNSISINGTPTVAIDGTNVDAFGRLRISEPYTIFDSALRYVPKGHFSNAISNGGTVTYDFNADVRNLTVTSSSGSQVIRESRRVFNYQPGKSLFVLLTFVMSPAKTNLQQRVGYFGANNGVFFEQVSSTKNMVIRSFSSGSIVEERIAQSSWNTDKLDGTGPSGITLDTTAPQIFFTDIEWLGVGTVRTGFVINGQFVVAHKFHHANNNTYTTTYMQTATLPIRYEITNLGATTGSSTMKQICCTVMSEGGYTEVGQTETAGTGVTTKRVSTAGTYIPLVSIRLNSNYLDAVVVPTQVDILSPSVNYYRWSLLLNPTLTGATWAGSSQSGIVDYDLAATAVSGGTEIAAGFADARSAISLEGRNIFQYQLGRTLANVSDVITLQITSVSNNSDVLGEIGWQILS